MSKPFKIGAKLLASMAMPRFCPRCMWYLLHCGPPPYAVFPSIFTELDLLQKNVIYSYIDQHGRAPKWMGPFAEAVGYDNVGFLKWMDEKNSILLKGAPDIVLYGRDKTQLYLGDLKTARYHAGRDKLLPLYEIQLLGYNYLLVKSGYAKANRAALFYFGPPSNPSAKDLLAASRDYGFDVALTVEPVEVTLGKFSVIDEFLAKARDIYDESDAPRGYEGCGDCNKLEAFLLQARHDSGGIHNGKVVDSYHNGKWRRSKWYPMADDCFPDAHYDVADEWLPEWAEAI